MVKVKNKTGLFRVHKIKDKCYKKGYYWEYAFSENKWKTIITRANLKDLEAEVKNRGLEWRVLNEQTNLEQ